MKRFACFVVIFIIFLSFFTTPIFALDYCCPWPYVPITNSSGQVCCGGLGICNLTTALSSIRCPATAPCDVATNTCLAINPPPAPSTSTPTQTTPSIAPPIYQGKCSLDHVDTALGCLPTDPIIFVTAFFPWALGIAGTAAFFLIIFGAFQHITAAGNPEQMQKAQELIVSALTGLVIIIFSVSLLKIIGVDIFKLPLFEAKGGG